MRWFDWGRTSVAEYSGHSNPENANHGNASSIRKEGGAITIEG
jgi:hypothetical protein